MKNLKSTKKRIDKKLVNVISTALFILFTITSIIIFIQCGQLKHYKVDSKPDKTNDTMSTTMKLSLHTKQFIKEIESTNKKFDESDFSDEFKKKYGIIIQNNQFFIGGLAKVNNNYNSHHLKNMNVKVNSKSGNIITLDIPLSSLKAFFKYDGVSYFEINQKVDLKNN